MRRLLTLLALARVVDGGPVIPSGESGGAGMRRSAAPVCGLADGSMLCVYEGKCACSTPGCFCSIEWNALLYDHMEADFVEVGVNVSCASIRRSDATYEVHEIRLFSNMQSSASELRHAVVDPRRCFTPGEAAGISDDYGEPVRGTATSTVDAGLCRESVELLPSKLVKELKNGKVTSLEVQVGPGAPCRGNAGSCDRGGCEQDDNAENNYFLETDVRVTVRYLTMDDSLTRLFLGIVFAIVWTLIMSVPLILWLRRRRARGSENLTLPRIAVESGGGHGGARGATRNGARVHGLHTKPRRFKALKVTDWVAERGIAR
jgi:hypothetical protein